MKKKERYDFLDDRNKLPVDEESLEMANLLREVAQLEEPDPDPDYWNHFNSRLWQQLDTLPQPAHARVFFRLPLWLGTLAAAVVLFFLLRPTPISPVPSLNDLDGDSRQLLGEVYDYEEFIFDGEEETYTELAENEVDLLLDVFQPFGSPAMEDDVISSFDAKAFKDLWYTEG